MSRHRKNGLSFVSKKMLTWVPGEARGGLKATASERVTALLSLYPNSLLLLFVSFIKSFVYLGRLCSKPFWHILDIAELEKHNKHAG